LECSDVTDFGISSWLRKRRVKSANSIALIFADQEWTYAEIAGRVGRLASALAARGVGRGDRIAYLGENDPSFLETLFATATLGAIFVPINTRLAPREIAHILTDSGATTFVFGGTFQGIAVSANETVEIERQIVVHGDGTEPAAEEFDELLTADSEPVTEIDVSLDDPALILYTSGTTGSPKGAVLTHGNLTWNSINVLVDYDVASTDRALMVSPLFHVASLGMGTLPAILKGATIVLESRFDPERVLALIEKYRISWISGVPTTFQLLCESPAWMKSDISSLRILTCGGSPVPLKVIDAYENRGLAFTSGYGMTEAAPGVTSLAPLASRLKATSSGQPHFFTDVRLTDVDGQGIGEIEIRGRNVSPRYWNRPEESETAFTADGWFRSGDLGSFDPDGYLTITDRLKDMIISGGENIYSAEVELLIAEIPGVTGVAVIGVPHAKWGEVPIAILTVGTASRVTPDAVLAHLDGRLARYKIPKRLVFVDELPRTASGKVQKAILRTQYANQLNDGK
jgi:fatty-acyl-CoA synthase